MRVFVAGGDGCVGRATCRELTGRGHAVTAASRTPDATVLPEAVDTESVDVTDPDLEAALTGHDAVLNLVALPSHRQPRGGTHRAVHQGGTRHLVGAAEAVGIDRFVQLSALGVRADVDTAYFRAKRAAEDIVHESALEWVVVRPSVLFGEGCAIVPFLRRIATPSLAALPGGGDRPRFQPMWVGDLAPLLAATLTEEGHGDRTYEIGGPEPMSLREAIRLVNGDPTVVPVPDAVARAGFAVADRLPGVPLGRDQYRVLDQDNTTDNADLAAFDADPDEFLTLGEYLDDLEGTHDAVAV